MPILRLDVRVFTDDQYRSLLRRHSHLQYLNTCSTYANRTGKAWEIWSCAMASGRQGRYMGGGGGAGQL